MGILLSKEIEDLSHNLFKLHHHKRSPNSTVIKWESCSQDLRDWYLLEANYIVRELGYTKIHPSDFKQVRKNK